LEGTVTVFDMTMEQPRSEEWSNIKKLISRAEMNRAEGNTASIPAATAGSKNPMI
jgi:hypothetical protein